MYSPIGILLITWIQQGITHASIKLIKMQYNLNAIHIHNWSITRQCMHYYHVSLLYNSICLKFTTNLACSIHIYPITPRRTQKHHKLLRPSWFSSSPFPTWYHTFVHATIHPRQSLYSSISPIYIINHSTKMKKIYSESQSCRSSTKIQKSQKSHVPPSGP